MSRLIWLAKLVLPYVVLFGGLGLAVCDSPPWQDVGVALYLAMFVYATLESYRRYHPR